MSPTADSCLPRVPAVGIPHEGLAGDPGAGEAGGVPGRNAEFMGTPEGLWREGKNATEEKQSRPVPTRFFVCVRKWYAVGTRLGKQQTKY